MNKLHTILPSAMLATAMLGSAHAQVAEPAAQPEVTDEIVVRGVFVPDEKRATSEIASVLDEEAFLRAGDADIAGALRRVTGVTITDGKFPVVRGLNERYSSATLNGVPLPSPEPLRRAAPLDLFPTSILEGTLVQKTYSPQYSGEFGGGLIELRARAVPNEDFLTVGLGFSFDTQSTLVNGIFTEGSDTDVLGFDDGLRDLPGAAAAAVAAGDVTLDPSVAVQFDQRDTLLLTQDDVPGNGGGSIAFGKIFVDDADLVVGTTFYGSYDNQWQVRDGVRERIRFFDGSDFILGGDSEVVSRFDETRQNIRTALYNTTGAEFGGGDHEIALTSYLLRDTLNRAQINNLIDPDVEGGRLQRQERADFIERQVWQAQLNGAHLFAGLNDAELTWRAAYGEAERDAPYERQTTYLLRDDDYTFFEGTNDASFINFSYLKDENIYAGADLTVPFEAAVPIEVSVGAAYSDRSRAADRNDFSFDGALPEELLGSRADLVFSEPVLGNGLLALDVQATPLFPNATEASLETVAAYAMADVELSEYLRASVGVRFEDATQESTADFTGDTVIGDAIALEEDFLLPAVTVTWNPTGSIQLRAGYSQTVTRPQFRELAGTEFNDPDLDINFIGNPFLVNSELKNYDLRGEWYFGRGQFVTLGAFYKEIENPIEQFAFGNDEASVSFLNAPSADLYGAEFEFEKRVSLDEMGMTSPVFAGRDLFFATNYTWSDSEVGADGDVAIPFFQLDADGNQAGRLEAASGRIEDGRRLQGQSEHLFNVQLGLENPDNNGKATLLLNYASDRILIVGAPTGTGLKPAVVEEPPVSLDFVLSQDIELGGGTYGLGLKVTNILGEEFSAVQTDASGVEAAFQRFDRGRIFAISAKRSF